MAKKPSTVNLEESIWNDIEHYMEENGVNRNTAIEWMLLERRILISSNRNDKNEIKKEKEVDINPSKDDVQEISDDNIELSVIDDILEGMPD